MVTQSSPRALTVTERAEWIATQVASTPRAKHAARAAAERRMAAFCATRPHFADDYALHAALADALEAAR